MRFTVPLRKAGPYIGPKGGKWADFEHKTPWQEPKGAVSHYPIDKKKWAADVRARNAAEDKTADTHVRYSLRMVPVEQLAPPTAWSSHKLDQVTEAFKAKKQLPPVRADVGDGGLYVIEDGNHRVRAAMQAGHTHVPVLTSWIVQKPGLRKAEGPYIGPKGGKWADPEHTIPWRVVIEPHPALGWSSSMSFEGVHDVGKGRVKLGKHGPTMPRESLPHFINDLHGRVDVPEHASNAAINAVREGKAKLLGKGDDGLAFKVGDQVVKVSTTVPYQPTNDGHRSPAQAASMLEHQVKVGNALAEKVEGVQRSTFVRHGDKGFQIKPYVELPEKFTRAQLDTIQGIVHAIHAQGYSLRDTVQAGLQDGKPVLFDVGKAAPIEGHQYAVADDLDHLRSLYADHGERFENTNEDTNERDWRKMVEAPSKISVLPKVTQDKINRVHDARVSDAKRKLSGEALAKRLEDLHWDRQTLEAEAGLRDEFEDYQKSARPRFVVPLSKAGPYIGPKGGKWANPEHTIPWGFTGTPGSAEHVSALASHLAETHGAKVSLQHHNGTTTVSGIHVPKAQRGQGTGDAIMSAVERVADAHGHKLILTPDPSFGGSQGGSKTRLAKWYKRRGFVENKGKHRDFTFRETMYREPVKKALSKAGGPYIGPKGGKWANPEHTIPWVENRARTATREPMRTGVIGVNTGSVMSAVNRLLGTLPEDHEYGFFLDGEFDGRTAYVPIVHPGTGEQRQIEVELAATHVGDSRGVTGALQTRETANGPLQSIMLRVDKRHWASGKLKEALRSVLAHELTHAADPSILENAKRILAGTQRKYADKDSRRQNSQASHDAYLNQPIEVTARLQQIKRELQDPRAMNEVHKLGPEAWLEKHSETWARVGKRYTKKNVRRTLQAVAAVHTAARAGQLRAFQKAILEAIPEAVGEALFKAQGHKYIRRVPYTDARGKQRYRYYYAESAAARSAVAGEEVSLGKQLAKVLSVSPDGTVTMELDGQERRIRSDDWHNLLASHYGGDRYFAAAERRASQAVNAVLRHVPAEMLAELQGSDAERLEQLRTRVPAVYGKLQKAFQRAGIDAPQAKRVLGAVLERRGWRPNARAAAIGHVLEHRDLNVRTLIRGAENLAGGKPVSAGHVRTMAELRHPPSGKGFAEDVAETAQRAEAELAKLSALLSQGKGPEALAQALSSPAMAKLLQLAQAMPGLRDKAIEPVRETLLQVPAAAPRAEPATEGATTQVYVAGENGAPEALTARYRLVEASDAIASHKPGSFKRQEAYPEGVQERAYHRDEAEQAKVIRNAHKLNPAFTVNTNPDAVNGPPVMDQHGVVLGGNSRTMSMQLAYDAHPERAAAYKAYLAEQAHTVGLKPSDVHAMKNPILVRVVESRDTDHQKLLVRQMNETFTQGMDPRTLQVAMGRKLDDASLRVLGDSMDPDETLSSFLDTKRSEPFVNALMRAGVIDQRNANQYMVKGTRQLNEDGKQLVSRILVGRTLNDADLLSDTNPKLIDNIARAVPYLAQAKTHGAGYDVGDDLKTAVSAYNDLRKQGKNLSADITDAQFQKLFNQQHMFEDAHPVQSNPRALALLEVLIRKNGPQKMAELFKEYAARAQHHPEGQASMFGDAPSPSQVLLETVKGSLAKAFGNARSRVVDFYLNRARASHLSRPIEAASPRFVIGFYRATVPRPK